MYLKFRFILLCCICGFFANAQTADYQKIDAQARSITWAKNKDIHTLATALVAGCTTEKEKARALFVWVTDNIKYDVKTFENRKDIDPEKNQAMQMAEQVLKSKKGVCAGYANLYLALCQEAGIQAMQVSGITKNEKGTVSRSGHAWCLVRVDGVWGLVDPTWGAGDVDLDEGKYIERFKPQFFLTPPAELIADHYPNDPLFQLLPNPLTPEEFRQPAATVKSLAAKNSAGSPRKGYAQITDSLNTFIGQDSVRTCYSIAARVLDIDPASNYGLYNLGLYHYRLGDKNMRDHIASSQAAQKNSKGINAAWCDQQIASLNQAKKHFTEASAALNRSTQTDSYSKTLRSFRQAADSTVKTVEVSLQNMKDFRSKFK